MPKPFSPRPRTAGIAFFVMRGLCAALVLVPAPLAQEDASHGATLGRVIELGLTDNRAMEHLEYLSKRIGHRLTSSTNLTRAEEWACARFAAFGLEARLERWGEFAVGFDRREARGAIVAPRYKALVFGTPAWRRGTPGPVRARAVLEPEDEDALSDFDQPGVWLVRRERPAAALNRVSELVLSLSLAGEVQNGGEPIRTGGRPPASMEAIAPHTSVRLRADDYRDLVRRLERNEPIELEFDIDSRFLHGPIPLHNVVADLRGTEFPDEYVIVGGHSDSWDGAEGAQDNGTGVATTLEAARLLAAAGAQPRRTIRFMLWSGEEQGLLGSAAYVKAHPELLPSISAVLVHDGGTNVLSGLAGPAALQGDLRAATDPLRGLVPDMPFRIRENDGLSPGGGSDHSPFVAAGVPGFFWKQGGRADDTDYDFVHHTQYDTLEAVLPHHLEHSALVVAVTAYNLAMQDGLLSRDGLLSPEPRRMGVVLDGITVTRVLAESRAAAAGWQPGDRILAVDGAPVADRRDVSKRLQEGDSRVEIRLGRGEVELLFTLDYSDDPDEARRLELRAKGARSGRAAEEGAE